MLWYHSRQMTHEEFEVVLERIATSLQRIAEAVERIEVNLDLVVEVVHDDEGHETGVVNIWKEGENRDRR